MRDAADRLAILTYWQMWIGGVGLVLLFFTLLANADAARSARRAVEGLERPYILIRRAEANWGVRTKSNGKFGSDELKWKELAFSFNYKFSNYGRVPCIVRSVNILFAQADTLPQNNSAFEVAEAKHPNWIISPHDPQIEDFEQSEWTHHTVEIKRWDYTRYATKIEAIYVRGVIEYEDVFGTRYERRFCYREVHGNPNGTRAEEWGGHRENGDRKIRRQSAPEKWWRNVAWVYIRHGFRHPAGPLPKKPRSE